MLYGMKFKDTPEMSWNHGKFYALEAIALTTAGPLLVFWRTGWLSGD